MAFATRSHSRSRVRTRSSSCSEPLVELPMKRARVSNKTPHKPTTATLTTSREPKEINKQDEKQSNTPNKTKIATTTQNNNTDKNRKETETTVQITAPALVGVAAPEPVPACAPVPVVDPVSIHRSSFERLVSPRVIASFKYSPNPKHVEAYEATRTHLTQLGVAFKEMYLLHGTSIAAMSTILKNHFNTSYTWTTTHLLTALSYSRSKGNSQSMVGIRGLVCNVAAHAGHHNEDANIHVWTNRAYFLPCAIITLTPDQTWERTHGYGWGN